MTDELFRAIYASTATYALRDEELVALLDVARRNNAAQDITGALGYHDQTFIQVLEGPEAAVEALLTTIAHDTRNTRMTVYDRARIDERAFGEWSMGWVPASDLTRAGFNPEVLFLRDNPSNLVNAMLEVFRLVVHLRARNKTSRTRRVLAILGGWLNR
jgi:hypothetical protein